MKPWGSVKRCKKYHYTRGMKLNLISPFIFIRKKPFSNAPWTLPLCKNGRVWRSVKSQWLPQHCEGWRPRSHGPLAFIARSFRNSPKVEEETMLGSTLLIEWHGWHGYMFSTYGFIFKVPVESYETNWWINGRKESSTILSGKLLPPKMIIFPVQNLKPWSLGGFGRFYQLQII